MRRFQRKSLRRGLIWPGVAAFSAGGEDCAQHLRTTHPALRRHALAPRPGLHYEAPMTVAQSLIEKGLLDGMSFSLSAAKETFTSGGWVWIALALAVVFLYKRFKA